MDGGGFGDDRGDDIGTGLWGWNGGNDASAAPESDYNRGWDNSNKDNGGWDTAWKNVDTTAASSDAGVISGWSAVDSSVMNDRGVFHANSGAAAADAFYSNLTRSLDTRADSKLFHMRNFNGWVKATQIAELDPDTSSRVVVVVVVVGRRQLWQEAIEDIVPAGAGSGVRQGRRSRQVDDPPPKDR